jgi:hypothetical protein
VHKLGDAPVLFFVSGGFAFTDEGKTEVTTMEAVKVDDLEPSKVEAHYKQAVADFAVSRLLGGPTQRAPRTASPLGGHDRGGQGRGRARHGDRKGHGPRRASHHAAALFANTLKAQTSRSASCFKWTTARSKASVSRGARTHPIIAAPRTGGHRLPRGRRHLI